MWRSCQPEVEVRDGEDWTALSAELYSKIGATKYQITQNLDALAVLDRLPRLKALVEETFLLGMSHLCTIERAVSHAALALQADHYFWKALDEDLIHRFTPTRAHQLLPSSSAIKDTVMSTIRSVEGSSLPTWHNHLMVSEEGTFPADLNTWETYVIDMEMNRPGARAWYRNPDRSNPSSLAISWQDTFDRWKALRPDFLFFHEVNGQVKASIVDPHGHHLTDALWKLRGMARYAERYGSEFHRIEAVARLDGDAHAMTVLDLTREDVREAIRECSSAEEAYRNAGYKYR